MCLITRQAPKRAEKPIIIYKCVTFDLKSPCFQFQYKVGETYETKLGFNITDFGYNKITEGFHAYLELSSAYAKLDDAWVNWVNDDDNETSVILKCEIPVGTRYITDYCSVATEKIKVLEILTKLDENQNY